MIKSTWSFFLLLLVLVYSCKSQGQSENKNLGKIPEYSKVGDTGPTMLLIPCFSCRWNEWESFMEQNKDNYSMYAVTLPGFGGNVVPDLPLNQDGQTPWRDNAMNALSNFIDEHNLKNIIVVGHSLGVDISIEFASKRPDAVSKVIGVDGSFEKKSWLPDLNDKEGIERAVFVADSTNAVLATNAEEWRKFNSATYKYRKDSIAGDDVKWALKLHGSFMATPKHVLHQYWRENIFMDLNKSMKSVKAPMLDIQSFPVLYDGGEKINVYLEPFEEIGAPDNLQHVYMYRTAHFIMQHRPNALNEIIDAFVNDKPLPDTYKFEN